MREKSLYDLLGVQPTASADEVRSAYRLAARHAHPDAGGSARAFEQVQGAYRVLRDPGRRHLYDLQLAASLDPDARPEAPRRPSSGLRGIPAPDARARRWYFTAMGVCLTLFVLAGALVRLYSVPAAVGMMLVAMVIPPAAAIAVNRTPRDR